MVGVMLLPSPEPRRAGNQANTSDSSAAPPYRAQVAEDSGALLVPFPGRPSGDVCDTLPSVGARIIEREAADEVRRGSRGPTVAQRRE
ncbi:MAG: hypothetical protein KY439_09460 [Actinobacteria bacterium]|nr:hypothetical protein [Actinomycetota bacterium]